jgi:hypothetical protein
MSALSYKAWSLNEAEDANIPSRGYVSFSLVSFALTRVHISSPSTAASHTTTVTIFSIE